MNLLGNLLKSRIRLSKSYFSRAFPNQYGRQYRGDDYLYRPVNIASFHSEPDTMNLLGKNIDAHFHLFRTYIEETVYFKNFELECAPSPFYTRTNIPSFINAYHIPIVQINPLFNPNIFFART